MKNNTIIKMDGGISTSQVVSAVNICFYNSDILEIYGGYESNYLKIIEFDGISVTKWKVYDDNIDKFLVEKSIKYLEVETIL